MPHAIFQTKFPAAEGIAEITFYGAVEHETLAALQLATCSTLQASRSAGDNSGALAGSWHQLPEVPSAPNTSRFVVNMPGPWECRRILQNVLRVVWLDVLESAGWRVASASNCEHGDLPSNPGQQSEMSDAKSSPGLLQGECTNFILLKQAHSPGIFAHSIDRRGRSSPRSHGLPLPEVVQRLLREENVLRWDPNDRCYVVLDGGKFEDRFNQLRKVRQKHKNGTVERPFSRMHNFYILDRGDKWAKTGTVFRPKKASYAPAGFQNDHVDVTVPPKKVPASSSGADGDSKAADNQGLAVLTAAVLPNAVSVGLAGAGSSAGPAGGASALAPMGAADYRMLSALMAAGGVLQPQLAGQGSK